MNSLLHSTETLFSNPQIFLTCTYPNFPSGFGVKFCVFWNSWNNIQTSKLVIDSKFNVIILTNIVFYIKTSFFEDLEINVDKIFDFNHLKVRQKDMNSRAASYIIETLCQNQTKQIKTSAYI